MRCRLHSIMGVLALSASIAIAQPITYQGRLTDNGQPASASYDVQFRLFGAPSGGLQLAAVTQTVAAIDGLFTAMPEFPAGTFTSATMYLEVAIRPAGGISPFTVLSSGRQRITPTPQAFESLGDRWTLHNATTIRTDPGIATVLINTTSPVRADSALTASRTTTSAGELAGIVVNNTMLSGRSFFAWATASETRAEAIVSGAGQFWLNLAGATAIDILPDGMIGLGVSANAADRLRVSGNTTIQGTLSATSVSVATTLAAGEVSATTNVSAANVSASSAVSSPSYRYPANQTRYHDVGAEEFKPIDSDVTYYINGGNFNVDPSVESAFLMAPVHLPHGATITNAEMLCYDNDPLDISFRIWRRLPTDSAYFLMTSGTSTGASASTRTVSSGPIWLPVIDEMYVYVIVVHCADWPGPSMSVKNVQIRYTVPGPD